MIKTGIYDLAQLRGSTKTWLLRRLKNISITLYNDIILLPNADELAERILLLFADDRGAYKRTYSQRFEDFDSLAIEVMQQKFRAKEALIIEDVGVSDARTACDFFAKVSNIFNNLTYYASDYNQELLILEHNAIKIVLSHNNKLLEIVYPPFVFNNNKHDRIFALCYPVNYLVEFLVKYFIAKPIINQYLQGRIQVKELKIFAPQALILAQKNPRFILKQHDLLQALPHNSAHVIRAMNVLNPSYFTAVEMQTVLTHIYKGIKLGGCFITGSNNDAGSIVQGNIYQKMSNGFQVIASSGVGAPIHRYMKDSGFCL